MEKFSTVSQTGDEAAWRWTMPKTRPLIDLRPVGIWLTTLGWSLNFWNGFRPPSLLYRRFAVRVEEVSFLPKLSFFGKIYPATEVQQI